MPLGPPGLRAPDTFYTWKKKYAHLGVSELRELRQLLDENRKLKGRSRT